MDKIPQEELVQNYLQGILSGDRLILSKAITLVESNRKADQEAAIQLLNACLPFTGNSYRLGISGVPGVGKSSVIDVLGTLLIDKGHKVAVLTVDPSSTRSGGSILGDKTRMERLSRSHEAFIRPSPSAGSLGGISQKTREVSVLCEAAGYNWILIETVGVGQSEVEVGNMVDFFLLLLLPNAGDEIQGMKKGIVEMADGIVINKAEKEQLTLARKTQQFYRQSVGLHRHQQGTWDIPVMLCSAWEESGFEELYQVLLRFENHQRKEHLWEEKRIQQLSYWFDQYLQDGLKKLFFQHPLIQKKLPIFREEVLKKKSPPIQAAKEMLEIWKES